MMLARQLQTGTGSSTLAFVGMHAEVTLLLCRSIAGRGDSATI